MSRQEGQKAKILALLQVFEQKTDDQHMLTVPELVDALNGAGIPAERKSIYTDIAALQDAGYDIEQQRGRGGGYYLASRSFELAELKILVDAVQSSRFITRKKSRELIHKLEGLASSYQASALQRQVFVSGRAKSENETSYYAVDALHQAIASDKMVSFQYWEWQPDGKKHPRREGSLYKVSPWALAWENDNYYLIAYQDYAQPANIRHYRVDRMQKVKVLNHPRAGKKLYADFDLAAYIKKRFNMYASSDEQQVTLRCANHMAGTIIDRFGTGIMLIPEEDGAHFHVTVPIAVSPQFLGWVCGLSPYVTILGPETVREKMCALAHTLAEMYP